MLTILSILNSLAELSTLIAEVVAVVIGVRLVSDVLSILERVVRALRFAAEATLLLIALALSVLIDAVVWSAPRLGRLAGRCYRVCRRHWPTVRRAAEAARLAVVRFVLTQAGHPPAPVQRQPIVRPVVARALPPLVPSLTRRQLLATAKTLRVPRYSRLSTDALRAALAAC